MLPVYWVYQTRSFSVGRRIVQARLLSPPIEQWLHPGSPGGIRSPLQDEPYEVVPDLVYRVNPKDPAPDNYAESVGFQLYSRRLIELLTSFGVRFEAFPVTMVDRKKTVQRHLEYFVFHQLEGVLDAMAEERSGWMGDYDLGVPRLVLDHSRFEHRPIFVCNHVFVPLMRDDLRQAIQSEGMTGFAFLEPGRYRSGVYGFPPDPEDGL